MKIAYIHVLPLEYYPPATNTLALLAQRGWEVRAWSTRNRREQRLWACSGVRVRRLPHSSPNAPLPVRIASYAAWHTVTALEVALWRPDVIISVEPHSALATRLYFGTFRADSRLFIHHHEYYSPEDFTRPGMRVLRATRDLERDDLFPRAEWISQTNEQRLALLKQAYPTVGDSVGHVWPNYPTHDWVQRAAASNVENPTSRVRFLYLGSASLEDTFIGEFAQWIARHPDETSLHVVGNNISNEVWSYLRGIDASNLTLDEAGWEYDRIPFLLGGFDVGLVLYKGNTPNFVYNVPNKAIEYLAAGLNVWYPHQMLSMREFAGRYTELPLMEMDFTALPDTVPHPHLSSASKSFRFTAENAIAPLVAAIENGRSISR